LDEVIAAAVVEIVEAVQPDLAFVFLREGERLLLKGIAPASGKELFECASDHRVGECLCGLAVREGSKSGEGRRGESSCLPLSPPLRCRKR